MQLIIDTANTALSVRNSSFLIKNKTTQRIINPKRLTSIAITTNCQINATAIKLAALNQVPIYFFNSLGEPEARLWSPYFVNTAELRKKQIKFGATTAATRWMVSLLKRKATLQIQSLQQWSRNRTGVKDQVNKDIEQMAGLIKNLQDNDNKLMDDSRSTILGFEGCISRIYFRNVSMLMPPMFQFEKRSRQPALDFFNSALNYLYGMTYTIVESGVFAKGFDPFAGYLHTDNYLKTSLVFDLIEPIRPYIDRLLADLIFSGKLSSSHFEQKDNGFWVSKEGKRILIPSFNEYLYHRMKSENKVMKFKDMIFNESFALGRFIDSIINEEKQ
ncbi:MAG: CRISPR-associated endonuclease Cas1 [Bacteroidales bacterium]|nr:CRISPR-associated endonuclease Cas1 [Bacteroidales bacterium]